MPMTITDDGSSINLEQIMLELMNSNTPFGQELKAKISSVVDAAASNLRTELSQVKVSPKTVTVTDVMGMDQKTAEAQSQKLKTVQDKMLKNLSEMAKVANFRRKGDGSIRIPEILGASSAEAKAMAGKLKTQQNRMIKAISENIPTKDDLIPKITELQTKEVEVPTSKSKGESSSLNSEMLEKLVENSESGLDLEWERNELLTEIAEKIGSMEDQAVEEEAKSTEGDFFEEEQKVIISGISKEAVASLAAVMATVGLTAEVGDISVDTGAKGGGLLAGLTKKLLPKGAPAGLASAGPMIALAGGLLWGAIDAIRGALKADEWGTSKVSGALGGLMGGMSSGIEGAFKNMGKWALIGAGIGSVVPVVGTIAGGLIGAAIGGILGFIGGENLAQAFDKIGSWFKENVMPVIDDIKKWLVEDLQPALVSFGETLGERIIPILQKVGVFLKEKVWPHVKEFGKWAGEQLVWFFENIGPILDETGKFLKTAYDKVVAFGEAVGEGAWIIWDNIVKAFDEARAFLQSGYEKIVAFKDSAKATFSDIWDKTKKVFDDIKNFITDIPDKIKALVDGVKNSFFDAIRKLPGGKKIVQEIQQKQARQSAIEEKETEIGRKLSKDELKVFDKFLKNQERLQEGKKAKKLSEKDVGILKTIRADVELADGGIVTEATNALIGEAGPEAVIPLEKYDIGTNLDGQFMEMQKTFNQMLKKFDTLIEVNVQTLKQAAQTGGDTVGELQPIPSNIVSSKPRVTEADYLRNKMLDKIYGV